MAIEKEYTLKLSTADAQANVDELNKSLKLQESLIDDLEKEIRQYEKQLDKTSKTDLAAQKKIKDALKQKKEALKDEKIALKDLNKDRKKANEELKEATENAADYSGALGLVDKQTGGLVSGLKNLKGGLGGATKGMNLLKVAIIGTGIGALLIAITAVTTAFKSSEEGQNKFAKLLGIIGSVVGNLVDLLADLGEGIIAAFENPKQALINLKNAIQENITNRIESLIDTFGFLGKAIKKVFSGDFKGALEEAKNAGSSYVDSLTGVKNTIDKVTESTKGFVKELKEEAIIAGQIADQRAKADKIERKNIVDRAKSDRDRAEALEKAANKEKFTAKERIEFLKEAGRLDEEITNKEIKAAELRLEAKQKENALSKSTKEDLDEVAQLEANLINLQTAKLRKQKEVTSQITGAIREEKAELKAKADEFENEYTFIPGVGFVKKEALEKVVKNTEQVNKVLDDITKQRENAKAETEVQKAELLKERKLKELEDLTLTKEQEAEIIAFYDNKITEAKITDAEKQKQIEQELVNFKKKLQTQNLNNISAGFNLLSQLAGKNKGLQAAAIIGESAVNVARSIIETQSSNIAITAQGAALAIPTAGASVGIAAKLVTANTIGAGIGIAANVAATAKALSALGKGGAPKPDQVRPPKEIPAPTEIQSQSPAFNIVGASGTNQLASAIGGQSQIPIQTYVVSSEVTTAQELDRNIIDDASIG